MKNAHIEHKMVEDVPAAARPHMAAMSAYAASIHNDLEQDNLAATIPKVTAVKKEMEDMLPLLTDPIQQEMYQYLLIPWITKLELDVNNGKVSKQLYEQYYAFKNAILKTGLRLIAKEKLTAVTA